MTSKGFPRYSSMALIGYLGLAVIAGVGPGLGASLSRRFAKEYKVVLLARSQGTLDTISESINKDGGEVGIS
jgi:short-subunit dehydrogenase